MITKHTFTIVILLGLYQASGYVTCIDMNTKRPWKSGADKIGGEVRIIFSSWRALLAASDHGNLTAGFVNTEIGTMICGKFEMIWRYEFTQETRERGFFREPGAGIFKMRAILPGVSPYALGHNDVTKQTHIRYHYCIVRLRSVFKWCLKESFLESNLWNEFSPWWY